jgi:hypothetical protein
LGAVENIVERLMVDITEHDIKVLAKRYITIAVNDKTAHDALAAQAQVAFAPLVVEGHEIEVF